MCARETSSYLSIIVWLVDTLSKLRHWLVDIFIMSSFLSAFSATSNSTRRGLVSSTRLSFTSHNGSYCYQQPQVVVELSRFKRIMIPSRSIVAATGGRWSRAVPSRRAAFLSTSSCTKSRSFSPPLAASTSTTTTTTIADQHFSNSGSSSRAWEVAISSVLAFTTSLALVWAFPTTTKSISLTEGAGHEAFLYADVRSRPAATATLAKAQPEVATTSQKATSLSRNRQSSPVLDEASSSQRRMYDVRLLLVDILLLFSSNK